MELLLSVLEKLAYSHYLYTIATVLVSYFL